MRTSIALLSLGAAMAAAQGLSSLPQCGQTCITNMLSIATSFGCAQGNITCYCTQPAFGYGVRDCANEACPSQSQAAQVIQYGTAYCKKALAGGAGAGASSAASSVAASGSTSSVSSSASAAANATASGSGSSGVGGLVAYTTSPLLETTKSGGSKVTLTTGTTTLSGYVSAETSVTKSGGSKVTMTTGTTTITGAAGTKAAKAASKKKAKATSGGGSGGGSGGSGGSGGGSGGSGSGSGGSGSGSGGSGGGSGGSSGAGNTLTAAPALIGAMLLAVLAL